jgi:ketosteroid isomerase-like protein
MQYPSKLDRKGLVKLAIKSYFANVDKKRMEAVLDCFHDEAMFTVQTAHVRHSGKAELRQMYETFFSTYKKIVHRDFVCTVDEKNGRIAASFVADLWDHKGVKTSLHNTNFWRIRDDKFQEVYVYMSGTNVLV